MVETVMAKVFITGSTGRLGKQLLNIFPHSVSPSSKELNVTDEKAISKFTKECKPDVVIHCAALTGIRECEDNKQLAWQVNVEGTENLVKNCERNVPDCYFVYVSTACVFHGDRGNYTEADIPYPKNFYSLTKLLGEFVVKNSNIGKWLIVRPNFVAREKWPYPKAFADRFGTYLFADDLARAMRDVIQNNTTGILHICGDRKISMFELARLTTPEVKPMYLSEYDGPPLTVDMSLNSTRIRSFELTKKLSGS